MNRDAGEVVALYSRVLQIPVCTLLLVQLPPRNQLCLMEFLIVCPEFERQLHRKLPKNLRCASDRWRQGMWPLYSFQSLTMRRAEGCFVHDFGDSVMLAVNSSSAVNRWYTEDMAGFLGTLPKTVECYSPAQVCVSVCLCVSLRLQATMACPPCGQSKNALKSFFDCARKLTLNQIKFQIFSTSAYHQWNFSRFDH